MKKGTSSALKFRLLQRDLGMPRYAVVGLLQSLWDGAGSSAPDGAIGRFSNEEIAFDLEYEGDPDELITALVKRRWIDENEEHRLVIHDWADHCEDSIHMRLARERKFFADGTVPKTTRLNKDERIEIERDFKRLLDTTGDTLQEECAVVRTEAHECALPSRAVPLPSRTVTTPCRTEPNPAAPGGAASVAAILSAEGIGGGGGRRKWTPQTIHQVSGDLPEALKDWQALAKVMKDAGCIDALVEAAAYAADCADPDIRRSKDLGPLKNPAGYMRSKANAALKDAGVTPPKFDTRTRTLS